MRLRYTPRSRRDFDEIFDRGAERSLVLASQVETRIRQTCERIGAFPEIGAATDYEDVRRMPIVRYPFTIIYRINKADDVVEILRVVRSASIRNLRRPPR